MKYIASILLIGSSLFSNQCSTVFPDVFSSEASIVFNSHLKVKSKSNVLQTPVLNQTRIKSRCNGSKCEFSNTTPNSLPVFTFISSTNEDTVEINEDITYEQENIPNIIVVSDNVTVTFKAPIATNSFNPIQKIGAIKIEGKNTTLVFEAGDYYIKSVNTNASQKKDTLLMMSKGASRLFVDENFQVDKNLKINTPVDESRKKLCNFIFKKKKESISSKEFIIYVKQNIELNAKYEISSILYGYEDIFMSTNAQNRFNGAIHANGNLTLGDKKRLSSGKFTYDEEAVLSLYKDTTCKALPSEVDEELNNSTVLGIDENRNGVRDDVELWIFKTYDNQAEQMMFMQSANAYQIAISDPSKAYENVKIMDKAVKCSSRIIRSSEKLKTKYGYTNADKDLEKKQFNTIKRHIAYERYNGVLSGGTFNLGKRSKDDCIFDIDSIVMP